MDHFLIGAPKCGTTSIAYYLSQHSQIHTGVIKEPKYHTFFHNEIFSNGPGDKIIQNDALGDYTQYVKNYASNNKNINIDCSPDLIYHPDKLNDIYKKNTKSKFIIALRSPASRAFSAYKYLQRDGRENQSFYEALNLERSRVQLGYSYIWKYIEGGQYFKFMEKLRIPREQIKVIIFEDFIKSPEKIIAELHHFLGVENEQIISQEHLNSSGTGSNALVRMLLNKTSKTNAKLRKRLLAVFGRPFIEKVLRHFLVKETIDNKSLVKINKIVEEDVERLEGLLNICLKEKWNLK